MSYGEWEKLVDGMFIPAYNGQWGYIDKTGKEVWKSWSDKDSALGTMGTNLGVMVRSEDMTHP